MVVGKMTFTSIANIWRIIWGMLNVDQNDFFFFSRFRLCEMVFFDFRMPDENPIYDAKII